VRRHGQHEGRGRGNIPLSAHSRVPMLPHVVGWFRPRGWTTSTWCSVRWSTAPGPWKTSSCSAAIAASPARRWEPPAPAVLLSLLSLAASMAAHAWRGRSTFRCGGMVPMLMFASMEYSVWISHRSTVKVSSTVLLAFSNSPINTVWLKLSLLLAGIEFGEVPCARCLLLISHDPHDLRQSCACLSRPTDCRSMWWQCNGATAALFPNTRRKRFHLT